MLEVSDDDDLICEASENMMSMDEAKEGRGNVLGKRKEREEKKEGEIEENKEDLKESDGERYKRKNVL